MGLLALFKTASGEVPYLQILLGVILGVIGTFCYFKIYKPLICSDGDIDSLGNISQNKDEKQQDSNENFVPTLVEPKDLPKIPTPEQKTFNDIEMEIVSEEQDGFLEEPEEEEFQDDAPIRVTQKIQELE